MPYLFNTEEDTRQMLESIGMPSVNALIECQVPADVRLDRDLKIPEALTEMALESEMQRLARKNACATSHVCFMGGGAYDHFIPAVVDALASRGEFFTSYTPYQPEVSQGNLQAMFEYETVVCQLTGLDVSNASLYDGGSATLEAVLMALTVTRRKQVVVPSSLNPEYRQILETYLEHLGVNLVTTDARHGEAINEQTAAVVIQHPNFFGGLEDVKLIADAAHADGALVIHVFDPISLGLLQRPADLGADIAVAEGQSLGNPLQFGGPYLGIMACRQQLIRQLPGRIAGETTDRRGRRCFVLTLQTREQHIRREKATSNICTNQGLLALRSLIYLSLLGPSGLRETAEHCLRKTHYAKEKIIESDRFELVSRGPVFKEFAIRDLACDVDGLVQHARHDGILPGIPLGQWYPELRDCLLIAVTEKRTRSDIDRLAHSLATAPTNGALTHA